MSRGQRQGIQWGIYDTDVRPPRPGGLQRIRLTGNPEHVTERAHHESRIIGEATGLIDVGRVGDAHRTSRAVQQGNPGRQQLIETHAKNRVRLATADLHEVPWPRADLVK